MSDWNTVYSNKRIGGNYWYPNEGIIKFSARYLKRRSGVSIYEKKRNIKRILDVGCGNGRHVIFFAQQGFDVYGFDISKEGIEVAKSWLKKENLKADLRVADVGKNLPYKNNYFDAVISCGTLDHTLFSTARTAINEIKRVLTPKGYLFITLRSTESSEFGRGKKTDRNTFLLQEGYEKGLIQHYFNLKEIKELLKGFRIFDIELHEQKFPSLYSLDKAFLQSSRGLKKFIDPRKSIDFNLKDSRWYIAAEKK